MGKKWVYGRGAEMKLWTLQPVEVYNFIMKNGVYRCKPELSECLTEMNFYDAYDWLVGQMKEKIGQPPQNVKYPVWAWHTTYGKHKKPDLRRMDFKSKEPMVCLEIEKSDDQVLLSDEENWHFVLSNWYFSKSEEDYNTFELMSPDEQEIIKRKSWERIFLIDTFKDDWISRGMFIQATFWELKKSDIRKVIYYGKRRKYK